jgi:4-amino-4-deoxy-L-arabinose transferase-like glycosyltransferase
MPLHGRNPDPAWRWRLLAILLILVSSALHIAYLAHDCPLDLAPDEAHYWDWSRHLDWSYYSKGPLVAVLIRGSCEMFGGWSDSVCGSPMIAIRLPAVACGALLLASLYVLTVQTLRSEKLAAGVVALALTLPPVAAGASLMTIDSPYTACWGWALVAGHRAAVRGSAWAWPIAGLIVGIGILAKYTMILWLPSMALFLLSIRAATVRERAPAPLRSRLRQILAGSLPAGFWTAAAVAALCSLPILIWNAQHGWVTFRHVGWQAGVQQREGVHWLGPLAFVGGQAALLLGWWFVAWAGAMWAYRPWKAGSGPQAAGRKEEHSSVLTAHCPLPAAHYLWWMSVPTFAVFLLASFKSTGQLNWAVTAYLGGLVLAAAWLADQCRSPRPGVRRLARLATVTTCALGLALIIAVHLPMAARPILLSISGPATPSRPFPLRRFDPTCRLRGWRTLATEVDRIRDDLRASGTEPIVAGTNWALPGMLGVYGAGHPTVYSFGLHSGDRHSQYDFWRPNPVADPEAFLGRTFVIVGGLSPAVMQAFMAVEMSREVIYAEGGYPVAAWCVSVCHGFRGFDSVPGRPY